MTTYTTHVRNILRVYARCTAAQRAEGLDWYPSACRTVEAWSVTLGIPRATVACVIAALSPQCSWDANLRAALALLTGQHVPRDGGVLSANIIKAQTILDHGMASVFPVFKVAPKVAAFSLNLQGCGEPVTVDTHAAAIALEDVTAVMRLTPQRYAVFAFAYVDAARMVDIRPCDLQATCWLRWRREFSPSAKRFHLRSGTRLLDWNE